MQILNTVLGLLDASVESGLLRAAFALRHEVGEHKIFAVEQSVETRLDVAFDDLRLTQALLHDLGEEWREALLDEGGL